jgi:hypothetical protein
LKSKKPKATTRKSRLSREKSDRGRSHNQTVCTAHPMIPFSRALGRSACLTRLPLRSIHSRVPFSLSHWSEPTGNGLVPIVVEQTVRVGCARTSGHTHPCWLNSTSPRGSGKRRTIIRHFLSSSSRACDHALRTRLSRAPMHHTSPLNRDFRFGTLTLRSSSRNFSSSKQKRHQNLSTCTSIHPEAASPLV